MKLFACLISLVLFSALPVFAQDLQSEQNADVLVLSAKNAKPYHKHRHLRFICFAENEDGKLYRAVGVRSSSTQARAMNNCYRETNRCFELGCRVRRR